MRVLITGVTGQDGSYLAEQLAAAGHQVFGLIRGQANHRRQWIQNLVPSIELIEGDLLDQSSLYRAITIADPEVIYNLGAITYIGVSWNQPTLMSEVTGLGPLRMLEAIRAINPDIKFVQASTSEMFGNAREAPQNETTPLALRSPYGAAKAFAHHLTINYRESYNMHASTAIMFNHESPRRGLEFVTRKVTHAAAEIADGWKETLRLGSLTPCRDWGWAPEYMRALPLIAARDEPGDYVLATGEAHSVKELCQVAFESVGLNYEDWLGYDESMIRPADVPHLLGDASKARKFLAWQPTIRFREIVERMVRAERESS